MKPVDTRHDSDCVAAAIAAVLELPIDEMPDFWSASSNVVRWQRRISAWLAERGFHWYYSTIIPRQMRAFRTEKVEPGCTWPPRGYWIAQISRVEWLRDREPNHCVVMRDHRCVFNPSGKISEVLEPDVWLLGYYLLIPLDPARLVHG